ncbi:MAG: hypothetical protein KBT11_06060 [Treponema sp.]|nr:hypothetical protein [Candidatus Treponema equifaecale]
MKLIEICVSTLLIFFACSCLGSFFSSYQLIHKKRIQIEDRSNRDEFIVRSVRYLCETEANEDAFSKFAEMCSTLWNFESFSVSSKKLDNREILLCRWTCDGKSEHVYSVKRRIF